MPTSPPGTCLAEQYGSYGRRSTGHRSTVIATAGNSRRRSATRTWAAARQGSRAAGFLDHARLKSKLESNSDCHATSRSINPRERPSCRQSSTSRFPPPPQSGTSQLYSGISFTRSIGSSSTRADCLIPMPVSTTPITGISTDLGGSSVTDLPTICDPTTEPPHEMPPHRSCRNGHGSEAAPLDHADPAGYRLLNTRNRVSCCEWKGDDRQGQSDAERRDCEDDSSVHPACLDRHCDVGRPSLAVPPAKSRRIVRIAIPPRLDCVTGRCHKPSIVCPSEC